MGEKVGSGTIFPAIRKATHVEMEECSATIAETIKSHLSVLCNGLQTDVKMMKTPTASIFEEEPGLKKALKELLKRAQDDMDQIEKMGESARIEAKKRGCIPDDGGTKAK